MYLLSITIIILHGDFVKCSLQCKSNINEAHVGNIFPPLILMSKNIHKPAMSCQASSWHWKFVWYTFELRKLATLTKSRDCSYPWGINTLIFYSAKIADATLHHNTNKTINQWTKHFFDQWNVIKLEAIRCRNRDINQKTNYKAESSTAKPMIWI